MYLRVYQRRTERNHRVNQASESHQIGLRVAVGCRDCGTGTKGFTDTTATLLQAEFAMRAQANQTQRRFVWLLVDQHEIRFDVAITMISPLSNQRVIVVARFQRLV